MNDLDGKHPLQFVHPFHENRFKVRRGEEEGLLTIVRRERSMEGTANKACIIGARPYDDA